MGDFEWPHFSLEDWVEVVLVGALSDEVSPGEGGGFGLEFGDVVSGLSDDAGGDSADDGSGGDVAGDDRAGGDDGVGSDGDALEDDCVVTDEAVVLDVDFADRFDFGVVGFFDHADDAVMSDECAVGHVDVVADAREPGVGDDDVGLDAAAVADGEELSVTFEEGGEFSAGGSADADVEAACAACFHGVASDERGEEFFDHRDTADLVA